MFTQTFVSLQTEVLGSAPVFPPFGRGPSGSMPASNLVLVPPADRAGADVGTIYATDSLLIPIQVPMENLRNLSVPGTSAR